jgi:outer membrane biosynthesis protein TonB
VTVERARSGGAPTDVLAALWARSRVTSLEEALRRGEADAEQIVALGLEHHLVTRFTSFVAVDLSRRVGQGDPTRVVQPVEAPEGVDPAMAGAREAASAAPTAVAAPMSPAPMPVAAAESSSSMRRAAVGAAPPGPAPTKAAARDLDGLLSGALGAGGDGRRASGVRAKTAPAAPAALSRAAIRDTLLRLRPALLQCYDGGLARRPTMAGRVTFRIVIGLDGRVTGATVASTTLADAAVEACVARVVQGARFPAHGGPDPVIVSYPLVFALDPSRPGHGTVR